MSGALAFDPRGYLETIRRGGDPATPSRGAGPNGGPAQRSNVVDLAEMRAAMAERAEALRGIMDAADVMEDRAAVLAVDG